MTLIVSGFPGVGKSHYCKTHPHASDSDSSQFSWLREGVRHPDWPGNYITHIEGSSKSPVLVSSHLEVRDALIREGYEFTLVYPSLEIKDEYINRYVSRGNTSKFIELLSDNFDTWITDLMAYRHPLVTHIQLREGQYLSDVLI